MQPIQYRIVVRGLKPGQAVDPAAAMIARLLKREPAAIAALFAEGRQLSFKLPDLDTARRYQTLFAAAGCDCAIDPDPDRPLQLQLMETASDTPPPLPARPAPPMAPAPPVVTAAARIAVNREMQGEWNASESRRRARRPLPFAAIAVFIGAVIAIAVIGHRLTAKPKPAPLPPLPQTLAAIRCAGPVTGYSFTRLGTLGVFLPCSGAEAKANIDKLWHDDKLTPGQVLASRMPVEGPFYWQYYYKRSPEGGFVADDNIDLFPEASKEVYTLSISFMTPRPGLDRPLLPEGAGPYHDPWDVVAHLPAPFGAAQDNVTFNCDGPVRSSGYDPRGEYLCRARFDAAPGVWIVVLRFGRPMPQDIDLNASFAEALDLASAHLQPPARP